MKKVKNYKTGDKYEIPAEGSLGLLALGYRGLIMWREVKKKKEEEKIIGQSGDEKE